MASRKNPATIAKLAREVDAGEKVIAKEKKKLKKTRSRLARNNRKKGLEIIEEAVEETKDYKEAVERSLKRPAARRRRRKLRPVRR